MRCRIACCLAISACHSVTRAELPAVEGARSAIYVVEGDRQNVLLGSDEPDRGFTVTLAEGSDVLALFYREPLSSFGFDAAELGAAPGRPRRPLLPPDVAHAGTFDSEGSLVFRALSDREWIEHPLYAGTEIADVPLAECVGRGGCAREDVSLCKLPCDAPLIPAAPRPVEPVGRSTPCPEGWSLAPIDRLASRTVTSTVFAASICVPPEPAETCSAGSAWFASAGACARIGPECPPSGWPEGADVYVDAAAAAGGDGSSDRPFSTIAAALSAPRRRIAIAPGSYDENVVVDQPGIVLSGGCTQVDVRSIEVRAQEAKIEDLRVSGSGVLIRSGAAAVLEDVELAGGALVSDGDVDARRVVVGRSSGDAIVIVAGRATLSTISVVAPYMREVIVQNGAVEVADAAFFGGGIMQPAIEAVGGDLIVDRSTIHGFSHGISLRGARSARITDLAVAGGTLGLHAGSAVRLEAGNLIFRPGAERSILVEAGSEAVLRDVTILESATAIAVSGASGLELARAAIIGFVHHALEVTMDSHAVVYHLAAAGGTGILPAIEGVASTVRLERALFEDVANPVLRATERPPSVPLALEMGVIDLQTRNTGPVLAADCGAAVSGERISIIDARGYAFAVFDAPARAVLSDVFVEGVTPELGSTCPFSYFCTGYGVFTDQAAVVEIERFDMRSVTAAALFSGVGVSFDAADGSLSDNAVALRAIDEAGARRMSKRVRFERNVDNISLVE